jgi:hypothetical protein
MLALSVSGSALPQSSAISQFPKLPQDSERDVIVIMRDQLSSAPPARRATGARTAAIAAAQGPVINRLQQMRLHKVHAFALINAFTTRVSAAEAAQLAEHPAVLAVVADAVIRAPRKPDAADVSASRVTTRPPNGAGVVSTGLCNTLEPEALQLTNTAFLDASKPQAQQVRDANGETVTGRGVKIAFIADGLDPNAAGFIRPDGSHVFIDYQDFSGDPAGTPTNGQEAFGDASSVAAQDVPNGHLLTFDISQFVNAAHPLPSPCPIRVRGMAPGASLVGLKVLSSLGYTTESAVVQAIEYAVAHDDVDIISESLYGSPFPDNTRDPISLANAAAVAAGVTVVVSTGDGGSAGTLGAPATDPYVIATGATTQFRIYGQTGQGAQALANGDISNNISALSSGGFAQRGARTVDVVAPGDGGWALCSTNTNLYTGCVNFGTVPAPAPIQSFGGTSESAPLTAGEAALVIQAYRSAHRGASPSPALIKRIIMATATDLGAPSSEQGAGLINSLGAVQVALSVTDENGRPDACADGLLLDPTSVRITAEPNSSEMRVFAITNTGSRREHLTPSLDTLGAPIAGETVTLNLDPATDPTFLNVGGAPRPYIKHMIKVPVGAEHLDVAVAFPIPNPLTSPDAPIVYLGLLDPEGRQAAYSIPQGFDSGYGHVDIVRPQAGSWTVLLWTRPSGPTSYAGPVQLTWAAERYVSLGSVYPSHLDLAPGATEWITARFTMPSRPGDQAAAIRFAGDASHPEIPVSLRALIPVGPQGGYFTGTLLGGNGRAAAGPTQTYEFNVPKGMQDMSLALEITDNGYFLQGYLIDPEGMELSVQPNLDPFGNLTFALQQYRENPQPGRWKFVLLLNYFASGNQTSLPFTARIAFNTATIAAAGLPNDPRTVLSASAAPLTATVNVTNTGEVTEAYFADARLSTLGVMALPLQPGCSASTINSLPGLCEFYEVPPQTTTVQFVAQAPAPIEMDAFNTVGFNTVRLGPTLSPDIFAQRITPDSSVATLTVPEVPYGLWIVVPALVGPFGASGAPVTPVTTSAYALLQPFDAAVASDSGDAWTDLILGTNTFNPLVLAPGVAGAIHVTITPDPKQVGQTISGYLYIDTYNPSAGTGDEVVRIPYSYTVGE